MQKVKNVFLFLLLSVSLVGANTQALAHNEDYSEDCEECYDCENCDCEDCDDCENCDCENCDDCHDEGNYYAYRQGDNGGVHIKYWDYCGETEDFIPEGATIREEGGIDVYIVKYKNGKMYKRLVLNPEVFENYEHLRWEDVLNVSDDVMDCFMTSELVCSEETGKVYKLYPNGDKGTKRLVEYRGDYWYTIDWDSVYTINGCDERSYITSSTLS